LKINTLSGKVIFPVCEANHVAALRGELSFGKNGIIAKYKDGNMAVTTLSALGRFVFVTIPPLVADSATVG
jgi:hypothetical protein